MAAARQCGAAKEVEHGLAGFLQDNQLDHASFAINQPGRVFGVEGLRLPWLQADHDLPLESVRRAAKGAGK